MAPTLQEAAAPPDFVRLAAHPVRWRLLTELGDSDYRVRELVARVDEPQSLVSYHLRLLRDGGLVAPTRSSFDGRDSYYHLDLERCAEALAESGGALHPALRPGASEAIPPTRARPSRGVAVLFVCTGNSARSPIAEALLRHHSDGGVTVTSAGSTPKPQLHPNTIKVLRTQFDIDVARQPTRHVESLAGRRFDRVITLCDRAREVCPEFGGQSHRTHWSIPDPQAAGETARASYPAFEAAAVEINTRVRYLLPVLAINR